MKALFERRFVLILLFLMGTAAISGAIWHYSYTQALQQTIA